MLRKSFWNSQSGNFGVIFAFAILPIMAGIGLAVDYARAESARGRLSSSIDATALALAHSSVNLTKEQMQAKARELFDGNFAGQAGTQVGDIDIERSAAELSVAASAQVQTTFLKLFNIATLDVTGRSKIAWGATKVEVVLVLDNTGSMKGTKLEELKTAANELIDSLGTISNAAGSVKIGLVPFATTVRVKANDYKSVPWIRFDDVTEWYQNRNGDWRQRTRAFNKNNWGGCIQDRDQSNDVTDILAGKTVGYEVGNSATLYPAVESCASDLQTIQPLTTDLQALKTKVDNMKAVGNTNVTIGISWGLAMLSHAQPFSEGVDKDDETVAKYLIVLTDGENTENRFTDPNDSRSLRTQKVDARTKLACETARNAGTVFTIRVIDGDKNLLEQCASKDEQGSPRFHDVQSANELPQVFRSIANEIAKLRITS